MSLNRVVRSTSALKAVARNHTMPVRHMASPPLHGAKLHDACRGADLPGPKFPIMEYLNSAPMTKTALIAVAVVAGALYLVPNTQHEWRGDQGFYKSEKQ